MPESVLFLAVTVAVALVFDRCALFYDLACLPGFVDTGTSQRP